MGSEMCIRDSLRGALDSIPEDVPSLSQEKLDCAIPARLVDPRKKATVADIDPTSNDAPEEILEDDATDIF